MSLVVDSISSSADLLVSDMLYKAAFVIALLRWAFYWALRLRRGILPDDEDHDYEVVHASPPCTTPSSSSSSSSQLIRDSLIRTTFEEVTKRQGNSCRWDTCAVCLSQLEMGDQVRELRNCCHVFHTECIDRWLDYNGHDHHDNNDDNHKTCPLCRTPLLTSSQIHSLSWEHRSQPSWEHRSQPSWAVERLLYLFGEDLVL